METALYLIPVTLGAVAQNQVLPDYNRTIISQISHFIVEEERTARRFLKAAIPSIDINALTFYPMGKHADAALFRQYLAPLLGGQSMGVISEAGCPAVADPGADIVAIAQELRLRVIPLVGPCSILLALMASGMNGQNFAFNGYLPSHESDRAAAIRRLEARSQSEGQTQIFIETPFRNAQMLATLLSQLHSSTRLCVAAGITCSEEFIRTMTVAEWRKTPLPELRKVPAIFLLSSPSQRRTSDRGRR